MNDKYGIQCCRVNYNKDVIHKKLTDICKNCCCKFVCFLNVSVKNHLEFEYCNKYENKDVPQHRK